MTYEEVYEYLKIVQETLNKKPISNENAIKINDLAIKAIEKQIPKKPMLQDIHDRNNGLLDYLYNCPICHMFVCYATELNIEDKFAYCPNCGQALDWSNKYEKENDNL